MSRSRAQPVAALAVALALLAGTSASAEMSPDASPPGDDFVRVEGARFTRRGRPFRFLGANVSVMHGLAHRAALDATLDTVRGLGLSVIRVWALGERPADAPPWARDFAFRLGPEGWVEDSFVQLDRVLAAARARDLSVIVVLGNRWGDYGGIPAYLRWADEPFTEGLASGVPRVELGRFFRSARARELYRAHLERVVSRVSSITGVAYRDDPTIFAWELMNELEAERRDAPDLRAWIAEMAGRVRAIDGRHLVSAGHIGFVTAAERRTWLEVVSMPEVDFADAHAYPAEWDRVRTRRDLAAYVADHVALAHGHARKPLVFGEYGFSRARPALGGGRARLFDAFLGLAADAGVDGSLAWVLTTAVDPPSSHAILIEGTDRTSREVTRVLGARARASTSSEVGPGPELASASERLWDPSRTLVGPGRIGRPRTSDGERRVSIAPEHFARARFESVGVESGSAVTHVWGSGHGAITYRFRAPPDAGDTVRVSVRASSELPGAGGRATSEDGSRVEVSIDDVVLGALAVPPDDGLGRRLSTTLSVHLDPGAHTLTLRVPDDDASHGLCLYGRATGEVDLDPGTLAELPGTVEVAFPP